jgi:hypothetical protein
MEYILSYTEQHYKPPVFMKVFSKDIYTEYLKFKQDVFTIFYNQRLF